MNKTFKFSKGYAFSRTLLRFITLWPLAIIVFAGWNILHTNGPAGFKIIMLSIVVTIMSALLFVFRQFSKQYGPTMYYEISVTEESLTCKNNQKTIVIKMNDLNKIKMGRSDVFIYYGNEVVSFTALSRNQMQSFFESIRQFRPDIVISNYFPFSFIKH